MKVALLKALALVATSCVSAHEESLRGSAAADFEDELNFVSKNDINCVKPTNALKTMGIREACSNLSESTPVPYVCFNRNRNAKHAGGNSLCCTDQWSPDKVDMPGYGTCRKISAEEDELDFVSKNDINCVKPTNALKTMGIREACSNLSDSTPVPYVCFNRNRNAKHAGGNSLCCTDQWSPDKVDMPGYGTCRKIGEGEEDEMTITDA